MGKHQVHVCVIEYAEKLSINIPKYNVELFVKTFVYSGATIWICLSHGVKMQHLLRHLNPDVLKSCLV